ncbi:microcin ABC transporter ATP-binding protein, partial [Klebsiella pneumoniae]
FITHDMGVVAEIADWVYVMRLGEIVESAPVEQLLREPRQDYTRKLLKSVPSLIPRPGRAAPQACATLQVQGLATRSAMRGFPGRRREVPAAHDVPSSNH